MTNSTNAPFSRSDYVAYRLTDADLPQIMELQSDVYEALVDKKAILRRTEGRFAEAMQPPHIAIGLFLGATPIEGALPGGPQREGGVLAAMSIARFPDTGEASAEVQSVYVSPHHRRKGLMGSLLAAVETEVIHPDKPFRLHCRVAQGNESAEKFEDAGYFFKGQTRRPPEVDPDGTMVSLYEKWLPPQNLIVMPSRGREETVTQSARQAQAQSPRR